MHAVSDLREELQAMLDRQYRASGWTPVRRDERGVLHATGPGGVTWFGLAIVSEDLNTDSLAEQIQDLCQRRMAAGGELCVLDLLPAPDCHDAVGRLLTRLGLGDRRNISLYALTAAAA